MVGGSVDGAGDASVGSAGADLTAAVCGGAAASGAGKMGDVWMIVETAGAGAKISAVRS